MNDQPAIAIKGLIKFYGNFQALYGVDLEVKRGEIFGFLGPNGAGKTTTIRCLLDLIHPNGGTLHVLGINPQADPVAVRARAGYLSGELRLPEGMTGEGVLRYLNGLRRKKADWGFVRSLAGRLDINLKDHIRNLSHGNKQKIGVIQALMHRPELLLLDEPTIGLDPLIQHEVLLLISEARDEGATIFFSSHIMSEVQAIAGRVAMIRKGEIVEVAETSVLINRALRRVRIRFREAVDTSSLTSLSGVILLSRDDKSILLQVTGEINGLVKALASYPVSDLETERPSLEEIFFAHYQDDQKQGG